MTGNAIWTIRKQTDLFIPPISMTYLLSRLTMGLTPNVVQYSMYLVRAIMLLLLAHVSNRNPNKLLSGMLALLFLPVLSSAEFIAEKIKASENQKCISLLLNPEDLFPTTTTWTFLSGKVHRCWHLKNHLLAPQSLAWLRTRCDITIKLICTSSLRLGTTQSGLSIPASELLRKLPPASDIVLPSGPCRI